MRMTAEFVCKMCYIALFVLIAYTNNNAIGLGICCLSLIFLLTRTVSVELAFMISLVMGTESLCITHLLICIPFVLKKIKSDFLFINKKIVACLVIILFSSLLNTISDGLIFNTIFAMTYYLFVFIIAKILQGAFNENKLKNSIISILLMEFVVSASIIIYERNLIPGDMHKGTFPNAHYFALWLICVMIWLFIYFKRNKSPLLKSFLNNIIWFIIGIFLIIESDGKNLVAGFVAGFCIYCFSCMFFKNSKNRVMLSIVILYAGMFLAIILVQTTPVKNFINKNFSNVGLYVYNPAYSYKFQYFEGTLYNEMSWHRLLFGYGMGHFGSRYANLFAYTYTYRSDNFVNNLIAENFESVALLNYAKYASLYNKELVDIIQWRSAVLSYPFSSIISLIAENGIIGLVLLVYILGVWAGKSQYGVLVVVFLGYSVFDLYIDQVSAVVLLCVLVGSTAKNLSQNSVKCSHLSIG